MFKSCASGPMSSSKFGGCYAVPLGCGKVTWQLKSHLFAFPSAHHHPQVTQASSLNSSPLPYLNVFLKTHDTSLKEMLKIKSDAFSFS